MQQSRRYASSFFKTEACGEVACGSSHFILCADRLTPTPLISTHFTFSVVVFAGISVPGHFEILVEYIGKICSISLPMLC